MKVQSDIEFTTMADIVDRSQIFYDPNPKTTIISEDIPLVELYNEVTVATEIESINSPWLLRFELNQVKM
jgi:DNA-directed RNA polymerase II subunit RPB1